MATSISALQQQYPLSPRKFWKKMIEKIFSFIVLLIIVEAAIILIPMFMAIGNVNAYDADPFAFALRWSMLGFGLWVVMIALYAWYVKTYIRLYFYDANENFVTIKKGVFAPAEIHVQYGKIQDVFVDQDILDRVMGLYDVHIASATAASAIEAHIDGVEKDAAEGLKTLLLARIQGTDVSPVNTSVDVPAAPIQFSEEVSIKNYPIGDRWIWQSAIGSIFSSIFLIFPFVISLAIPGKHSEPSLAESFNLDLLQISFVLFCIFFIFQIIWSFLWRATYSFAFLPEYIVVKKGIISRSETHLPYRSVQDVAVVQSIIERLFGLATVRIENASAPIQVGKHTVSNALTIPGQPLDKANHLSEIIRTVILTKNSNKTGV